ncbi:MAG: ribbon-helix-helix protein, CopG family [Candidatus Aminicenantes bacterium]|nr:ribbon-helix-helix protein, CopG family [Candidatus Aminicenantes bacterium]
MPEAKIAITMDDSLIRKLDLLVREKIFPNRSKAIQEAVQEKINKLDRSRLARECAKLDPEFEQMMAEEGLPYPAAWSE